jgi:hypothetical protein
MLETLNDRKLLFTNYINGLNVNEKWKQQLTDKKKLGTTTQVYLFYPELFWKAFTSGNTTDTERAILDKLCIAGYLYFGSIILQDKLIDTAVVEQYEIPLLISWMQEESLHILHSIYNPESEFWNYWALRRNEYFASVQMQKKSTPLGIDEYELLADYKAAFGKVAIDCCYILFKNEKTKELHKKLIYSHGLFSMAVQLLDDIEDMEEDVKTGQVNYLIQKAVKYNAGKEEEPFPDIASLKKTVYLSGIYEHTLDLTLDYFSAALKELKDLPGLDRWKTCILYKQRSAVQRKHIFNIYIKELHIKANYSHVSNGTTNPALARNKALEFIIKQQEPGGYWTDIVTSAGFSNVWTSGFVLSNINNCEGYTANKKKAVAFLKSAKKQKHLWGYSNNWMLQDTDSSTNVILALFLNADLDKKDLTAWLNWFRPEEGFGTYNNAESLGAALPEFKKLDGWLQAHDCVSALCLYLLATLPGKKEEDIYRHLKYILFNRQNHNFLWEGYWWTSPLYASCYIVKALLLKDKEADSPEIQEITDNIVLQTNPNGSYGTDFDTESCFYTALVLDTLCSSENIFYLYKKEIVQGIHWLQAQQFTDGSFPPSFILRIPAPDVLFPEDIPTSDWSRNQASPVNVVKQDMMRMFTTSLACSALQKYVEMKNKL